MKAFAALYDAIDSSTSTNAKIAAMATYFRSSAPADCAWAAYVLAGGTPKRVIATAQLRALACEVAGVDDWLFEASYQMAGDLAETIAHLIPISIPAAQISPPRSLSQWMEARILPLRALDAPTQQAQVREDWAQLNASERFLYVKLIAGGLRVGVAKGLVIRALSQAFAIDVNTMSQRMMGFTRTGAQPTAAAFSALSAAESDGPQMGGAPYPFFLAHALKDDPATFGDIAEWQIEWKYDGIRLQVVRRGGEVYLWSRGEELINETFPDLVAALRDLPEGTVIDGELLVWIDDAPAPFAALQTRLGRKAVTTSTIAKFPVAIVAYDCLEICGRDIRSSTQSERRAHLAQICAAGIHALKLSLTHDCASWADCATLREDARAQRSEGLMLKRRDAAYGIGRTGNAWLKWKLDPFCVDAVLTYAQRGHGRRAGLYTDYTFGVWTRAPRDATEATRALSMPPTQAQAQDLPTLVIFAKAYSGLTDAEIKMVDKVIKATALDDFGPVRAVRPSLVMTLGFEGIGKSARHKSGVAVRFPRILRIRDDKPLHEADTLLSLQALIHE